MNKHLLGCLRGIAFLYLFILPSAFAEVLVENKGGATAAAATGSGSGLHLTDLSATGYLGGGCMEFYTQEGYSTYLKYLDSLSRGRSLPSNIKFSSSYLTKKGLFANMVGCGYGAIQLSIAGKTYSAVSSTEEAWGEGVWKEYLPEGYSPLKRVGVRRLGIIKKINVQVFEGEPEYRVDIEHELVELDVNFAGVEQHVRGIVLHTFEWMGDTPNWLGERVRRIPRP